MKDKLFYFGTFQGTRVHTAAEGRIAFVPTDAQRRGDFSSFLPDKQLVDPLTALPFPNNQIPADRLSPVSQFFLKTIPLPNGPGGQLTYSAANTAQTENQFMVKTDYNRSRHQLSGRYFFTDFDQPPEDATQNLLRAVGNGNAVRVQNLALNHTFTLSPKTLFNTWFGWNQQRGGSLSSAP